MEGVRKTFDYVLMPLARLHPTDIEQITGKSWEKLHPLFKRGGYTISTQGENFCVEDCPVGIPSIIEIMTSSTSSGNKDKGTTLSAAFRDAIEGRPYKGLGINYRQVWARMVSQLIVKSEVALAWKGKAIWVVQDTLIDYISKSTALNIRKLSTKQMSEVNLLSFSYGEAFCVIHSFLKRPTRRNELTSLLYVPRHY